MRRIADNKQENRRKENGMWHEGELNHSHVQDTKKEGESKGDSEGKSPRNIQVK